MATRATKAIRKALKSKGFSPRDGGSHEVWRFEPEGQITDIFTIISRGSGYKDYGSELLSKMARQLRVEKSDLLELIDCPMTEETYISKLKEKGIL